GGGAPGVVRAPQSGCDQAESFFETRYRNASGIRIFELFIQTAYTPRWPVGRRLEPRTCGTSSTVMPIRSTMRNCLKSPKTMNGVLSVASAVLSLFIAVER